MASGTPHTQPRSFDAPQEPEWHRMIAEAAYYLAAERGFLGEHALDDWLIAEQQVRQLISPKKTEFGLRSKQKRVKKRSGPVFRSASSVKP